MATNRSSAGDPARTLELLWRQAPAQSRRGPKPGSSIEAVVAAAVKLADREGLEEVTMRKLAARVGIAPMALYSYLPGREELIDLMLDSVYASMRRKRPRAAGWRARLEAVADDNRALFAKHPWLAAVSTTRPPLGPGTMGKYEYELRALEGAGLTDLELDSVLTLVLGFVESCARAAANARAARLESKLGEAEWWRANEAVLSRLFDSARFPLAGRVGSAAGEAHGAAYSPEHAYRFGLARVLDGVGAMLARRRRKSVKR